MRRLRAIDLRDAVVVITGASSGVGRSTAHAFAAHGVKIVVAARGLDALHEVAAECERLGSPALVVPTDIADAEAMEHLRSRAIDRFGRIDVWVEAAAVLVAGPIDADDVDEVRRLIDTNVMGTYLGDRAALATFREQGRGTLINVSSLLGIVPNPVVPTYVMSKFAVRGLSLSLRRAFIAERDIHVCVVMPGPVDTPLFQTASNRTGRELRSIPPAYAPERVAAGIVACALRPRRQMTVGMVSHLLLLAHRIAPTAAEWGVAQFAGRLITRSQPADDTSGTVFEPAAEEHQHGGWRLGGLRRAAGERLGTWLGRRGAADPADGAGEVTLGPVGRGRRGERMEPVGTAAREGTGTTEGET